jgi:hypothetical protein
MQFALSSFLLCQKADHCCRANRAGERTDRVDRRLGEQFEDSAIERLALSQDRRFVRTPANQILRKSFKD